MSTQEQNPPQHPSDVHRNSVPTIFVNGRSATNVTDQEDPCPSASSPPKLRVAVIGSGLAGLSVAHLLSSLRTDDGLGQAGIDVHLFEKAHKLGMDAASLPLPDHEDVQGRMDVPMRTFFPEYYPNLVRLLRSIGVDFHDADNTLSCFDVDINDEEKDGLHGPEHVHEPYLSSRSYKVGMGQTITLPDLPPFSILNPVPFGRRIFGYYRIARDYLRLLIASKEFMAKGRMMDIGKHPIEWGNGRAITLRDFLEAGGYSNEFSGFFVPVFASVCSCSFERMMEYPACIVLEYVARCMPFGRMQFLSAGVRQVTEKLSANIDTIHYNTLIEDIDIDGDDMSANEDSDGSIVLVDSNGIRRTFDHVIFATQANQAAATLSGHKDSHPLPNPYFANPEQGYKESDNGCIEEHDQTESEMSGGFDVESLKPSHPFYQQIKTLLKFPYERTRVVCHTDTSFLPKNPANWRLLNIAKSSSADVLACPLDKISKELEPEMELRSRKARSPRSSAFSLRSSSALSKAKVPYRQRSRSRLRAHFAPATDTKSQPTMAANSHNSAMATHFMDYPTSDLGSTTKCLQTTNPLYQPRPDTVISSAWFEHTVVNPASMKAVDELNWLMEQQTGRWIDRNDEVTASDRVWFVGSYAYPGIPLLEASVASAVHVVDRIMAAEPSRRLAPSAEAAEHSFLKQSMSAWGSRRERQTSLLGHDRDAPNGRRLNHSRTMMTSVYFQTAWRDALHDSSSSSGQVESWRSNIYVEMAWMLMLYLVAIGKWFLVIMVESLGGDGSHWASA
ncbi:hypothetical protein BGX31_002923 [Mortierella sp. GBA43]|nr:hypothetical protein BGX31_002923 [Mortierella sp. GBA43]